MKEKKEVTERIKTYEDACAELGIESIDEKSMLAIGFNAAEIAGRKLGTITEALNEGWKADWRDGIQKKWIPYFWGVSPSGFAFRDAGYHYTNPGAGNASRLCFKSEELANYSGKQFLDLYFEHIK